MKNMVRISLVCVAFAALSYPVAAKPPYAPNSGIIPNGPERTPAPGTIDQIIHNMGNIVTTIDNWGYVGGYEYSNLPSGEWPRNSGNSYIGELFYWMGAITANGDTVVADAYEDFQAIPSIIAGNNANKILLSTDTTRYYDYDPTDTVGLGRNNPARGWRLWNDSTGWDYSKNYNPITSTIEPGGPTALQVSHYRFNDAATGSSILGLEMTHTVLQWNYCYNEDFVFVILEITNTSATNYADFVFGLYADIDVGGPDGSGENGRLEDLVGFDSTENLAWTYDRIGKDPGWGPTVRTGFMGTKYLETPDNIGMTSFRNEDWALIPRDDPGRYAFINSTQFDSPQPPTDQLYIQCTRGIQLDAGKTVRVVYALIAGEDEEDLRDNADLAQQLYDNYFVGPQPPNTPKLTANASDRKVYLSWTDTSEVGIDPLSGENDFSGYKLYRSEDRGETWGEKIYVTNNSCLDLDYKTLATFEVNSPGDPIQRSFIDTALNNGVEYWYCLASCDTGASAIGVDKLQSGFGVAGQVSNVIAVTPRNNPAGFYEAAGTVSHLYTGTDEPSVGSVLPIVFDRDVLQGSDYRVVFQDTEQKTNWHLINETTGDTVLANQDRTSGDPGLYDVAEGLRVVVTNGDHEPRSYGQTTIGGGGNNLVVETFYGIAIQALTGDPNDVWGDAPFRATYEFRYTGDSTIAPSLLHYWSPAGNYTVPFEIWNVTTNQRVSCAVYDFDDDGVWNTFDLIAVVDYPYSPTGDLTADAFPYYYSWLLGFDENAYSPSTGDIFTIEGAPLNGPDDVFVFRADGVSAAAAAASLKDIKVVPNPYYVHYAPVEFREGESILEFQKLPNVCTVRIYTLAGDLVQTIENTGGDGVARWNLQSSDSRQVASGTYIYHVESPYGTKIGRFAVIK